MEYKTLKKSKNDKVLAGVCGGIAHYFNLDPIVIRVLFLVFSLMAGTGIFLYVVLAIIIPTETTHYSEYHSYDHHTYKEQKDPYQASYEKATHYSSTETSATGEEKNKAPLFGIILVGIGIFVLIHQLIPDLAEYLLPVALIVTGIGFIFYRRG